MMPNTTTRPTVIVNGRERAITGIEPHVTALDWLRDQGLTGAKEGCAEGECGACSVLVARPGRGRAQPSGPRSTRACCRSLAWTARRSSRPRGSGTPGDLHPVQQEMAVRGGSQCGYCTPGFICSMAAEYYRPGRAPAPSPNGHGAGDHEHGPNGFDLHALSRQPLPLHRLPADPRRRLRPRRRRPPTTRWPAAPATPAPAAPPRPGCAGEAEFVRPADLADALALLAEHPDATVVAGCTDWGVEVNIRGARAPFVIAIDRLPELRTFTVGTDEIELGAALTLSEVRAAARRAGAAAGALFPQFASRLIRNGATLGGNLGTGSPIGDAPPALLALRGVGRCWLGPDGEREVPLAEYFTGYRQAVRRPTS